MLSWLVRVLLIVAGVIAEIFVARDAVNFALVQGVVALLLGVLIVFVLAFWPARWTLLLNGNGRKSARGP